MRRRFPVPHVVPVCTALAVLALALAAGRPARAITGGEEADPGEWPWQVALIVDGELYCGGSLLAADLVLTAAHCTQGVSPSEYEVMAGSIDITDDALGQRREVVAIDQHEDYDEVELRNDLSLLTLESPFELDSSVAVIELAGPEDSAARTEEGDVAVVTGFGATGENADSSDVLLEAEIRTVADSRCESLYREDGDQVFGETQVCAGLDRGRVDSCYGDSGGPLVVPVDDERTEWLQVGIVSWGAGCGQPLRPTIYTEVSAFGDWLGARGVGPAGSARFEGDGARIPARGSRGKAGRYPLRLTVNGFDGRLEGVSVRLLGLSHDRPEDLDIWLVAPDGTVVTLLSDVGGDDELDEASLLIVDGASPASGFALAAQLAPTDREPDFERKGAVAPADLAELHGVDPNGTWQLLVADDRTGASGRLEGWSLQLR